MGSGAVRSVTLLPCHAKRGVIVDAEDYLPITGTYEEHPLSKVVPKAKNIEELKQIRKQEYRDTINKYTKASEERRNQNYNSVEKPYIRSEFLSEKPPEVTSIKQRRQQSKVEARRREGLTDDTYDTKNEIKEPSLQYITNPKIFSK